MSNIYVGTGDDYVHFGEYTLSDTPIYEWEEGAPIDVGVAVFDSLGNSAAAYSRGNFTNIAPVPEPSTLLLFSSGLLGVMAFRRKFKR